jgi:multiple sugar transport system permease protein
VSATASEAEVDRRAAAVLAASVPRRRGRRLGALQAGPGTLVAQVLLGLSAIYFVFPLVWLVVASARSNADLFDTAAFWTGEFALLDNLRDLFTYDGGIFWSWLGNSMLYAGVGALVSTITAGMAGYAFAQFDFPGRNLAFGVVLAAVLVPQTALALPLYLLASEVGMTNTLWSVLIPGCISPLGVYLARIYAQSAIPRELIEAARMDGSSELRIMLTVGARIMSPALITVFLFQFVNVWNNFFLPLVMLSNDKLYPLSLGLQSWSAAPAQNQRVLYNIITTGSLLSIIPLAIGFLVLQRWWRKGLTFGSVVG